MGVSQFNLLQTYLLYSYCSGVTPEHILVQKQVGSDRKQMQRTNWAGNHTFRARRLCEPTSVAAIQDLVAKASYVHGLGTRHSFSGVADTVGDQISLAHLNEMTLDAATFTVTIGGGVTYAQLAQWLHKQGYALQNLASLSNTSVAGAIQTGTHGSGLHAGILATAVVEMKLVTASGELFRVCREAHGASFSGMVVGLGLLGIVVSLTLRVEPDYSVSQRVYQEVPLAALREHLREVFTAGDSVSCFTKWNPSLATQVWIKSRKGSENVPLASELMTGLGAREASQNLSFVDNRTSEDFTAQLGVPGPWFERLPHFRAEAIPSHGKELQSEYFVAVEDGPEALEAVIALRECLEPLLQISELRAIDADNLWLSPAQGRQSLALEFTWKPDWHGVREVLPKLEQALEPFDVRPHWAKLFAMRPAAALDRYANASAFRELRASLDPSRKFVNDMLTDF